MEEEGQGAALPSVVASPSRADWAGGQLSAFPDGSEPSAGLWPAREEAAKKTKDCQGETSTFHYNSTFQPIFS